MGSGFIAVESVCILWLRILFEVFCLVGVVAILSLCIFDVISLFF